MVKDTKDGKPVPAVNGKSVALCVFHAEVKAAKGKGQVTAVVRGEDGKCSLLGATMLCKVGCLPMRHYGLHIRANRLAALLGVKVITGKAACAKYLTESKIDGILADDILADSTTPAK